MTVINTKICPIFNLIRSTMVKFLLITFSISIILSISTNMHAQEGGMEDVKVVVPAMSTDSLEQENLIESETPIEADLAPAKTKEERLEELKKRFEQFHQLTPSEGNKKPFQQEDKIKENKKDLSFNIFYYLIYKYKQVDVFGD